jgi:hypothetical protein
LHVADGPALQAFVGEIRSVFFQNMVDKYSAYDIAFMEHVFDYFMRQHMDIKDTSQRVSTVSSASEELILLSTTNPEEAHAAVGFKPDPFAC